MDVWGRRQAKEQLIARHAPDDEDDDDDDYGDDYDEL